MKSREDFFRFPPSQRAKSEFLAMPPWIQICQAQESQSIQKNILSLQTTSSHVFLIIFYLLMPHLYKCIITCSRYGRILTVTPC